MIGFANSKAAVGGWGFRLWPAATVPAVVVLLASLQHPSARGVGLAGRAAGAAHAPLAAAGQRAGRRPAVRGAGAAVLAPIGLADAVAADGGRAAVCWACPPGLTCVQEETVFVRSAWSHLQPHAGRQVGADGLILGFGGRG